MTRFTGRLFTVCAAASLLACAAVVALWVRSADWQVDGYVRLTRPAADAATFQQLISHDGVLFLVIHDVPLAPGSREVTRLAPGQATRWASHWPGGRRPEEWPSREYFGLPEAERPWERLGLYARSSPGGVRFGPPSARIRTFGVPYWIPAAAAAALPLIWLRRVRRTARRRRDGQCARCGYDLRASPGRCPECGAANAVTG